MRHVLTVIRHVSECRYLLWVDLFSLVIEQGLGEFLASFWNLLDVLHLGVMVGLVVNWALNAREGARAWEASQACAVDATCFVDFGFVVATSASVRNTGALAALLSVFKVFKYAARYAHAFPVWASLSTQLICFGRARYAHAFPVRAFARVKRTRTRDFDAVSAACCVFDSCHKYNLCVFVVLLFVCLCVT